MTYCRRFDNSCYHHQCIANNSKKGANEFCAPTETLVQGKTMQIKWGKHFSEPFHVSNGVRQGLVLRPYLFAVYLDDLSNELNNIKAGCYVGEVLLIFP